MSETKKDMLQKRVQIKSKKPDFIRSDATIRKKIKSKWKKPTGRDNKIRRRLRGALPHPSYSSPNAVKGMHPTGLYEKLVSCIKDLEGLDAKEYIVRIRATVGNKKKRDLVKKAKELKLKIANPSIMLKPKADDKKKKSKESKPKADDSKKESKAKAEPKKAAKPKTDTAKPKAKADTKEKKAAKPAAPKKKETPAKDKK